MIFHSNLVSLSFDYCMLDAYFESSTVVDVVTDTICFPGRSRLAEQAKDSPYFRSCIPLHLHHLELYRVELERQTIS